jgi:hypothetical protein
MHAYIPLSSYSLKSALDILLGDESPDFVLSDPMNDLLILMDDLASLNNPASDIPDGLYMG